MQFYEIQDEQSLRAEQLRLEEDHDAAAVAQVLRETRESLDKGDVSYNPQVHNLLRAALPKVREVLEVYRSDTRRGPGGKYRQIIREINIDVLSACCIIATFSHYFACVAQDKPMTFQSLARYIGHSTVIELMVAQSTKVNPMYMSEVFRSMERVNVVNQRHISQTMRAAYRKVMPPNMSFELSPVDYVHIGKFGADACYQAGLIQDHRSFVRGKTQILYYLDPDIEQYLYSAGGEGALSRVVATNYHRMVCKPDPWDAPFGGGYLSVRRKARCGLIVHTQQSPANIRKYLDVLDTGDMSKIYACANYLQEVPYCIHTPTQNLIRTVWQSGGGMFGIPSKEMPPKPEFPFPEDWDEKDASPEERQAFRLWRRRARDWYTETNRIKSHQREVWGFLKHLDTGHDKMYFPVFLDRRGRWYYRAYPNPQGSDISRGTLHFYNKKPLGKDGVYWLKVHIANLLGVDDIRFDARVAYVEAVWEDLKRGLSNPLDYHEVFGTDAPISAYGAVYELNAAYESGDPESYETGVPVHMDATVSGTQHFSALLRDPIGAKYSNLYDSGGDTKADLYKAVADTALEAIRADLSDERRKKYAELWLSIGVPRGLAKRPVMTYTYNVTLFSVCNYLQEWLDDNLPEFGQKVDMDALRYLGKHLFKAIDEVIPATSRGMKYLSEVGKELGGLGPMHWFNPATGMLVYHEYTKHKDRRVRVRSAGISVTTVREQTTETRASNMASALAPNFIHSLDAAHLTMTALEMQRLGLDMVGIHDSFGTHPSDVPTLHKVLREQFLALYTLPILEDFKAQVKSSLPIPETGSFDLELVLDSEFMFS